MFEQPSDQEAEDAVRAGITQLALNRPFYGYLVMYLDLREMSGEMVEAFGQMGQAATIAVTESGKLVYNPGFVKEQGSETMKGLICHEVMHLALRHLERCGDRSKRLWNVAADIQINDMLVREGFDLPEQGIIPSRGCVSLPVSETEKVVVEDIPKKSTEQVYHELLDKIDQDQQDGQQGGQGGQGQRGEEGDGTGGGEFGDDIAASELTGDTHIYDGVGEQGESVAEAEEGRGGEDWEKILQKAAHKAEKERGDLPAGVDRVVERVTQPTVDWRRRLRHYISNEVVSDYTWSRPSKKMRSHGIYMPDTDSEGVDVLVALDLSGSISDDELSQFAGEMADMCEAFESVNLTVVQHDAKVQKVDEFRNASRSDVKNLGLKGGGGTNHVPVFEHIGESGLNPDIMVAFTDLMSRFPDTRPAYDVVWAVMNHRKDTDWMMDKKPFGDVVEVKELET